MTDDTSTIGRVHFGLEHGQLTLLLVGEFDQFTSAPLHHTLECVSADPPDALIIDASDVTFASSALLAVLLRLRAIMSGHGTLILQRPSAVLQRTLELTNLTDAFDVELAPTPAARTCGHIGAGTNAGSWLAVCATHRWRGPEHSSRQLAQLDLQAHQANTGPTNGTR